MLGTLADALGDRIAVELKRKAPELIRDRIGMARRIEGFAIDIVHSSITLRL